MPRLGVCLLVIALGQKLSGRVAVRIFSARRTGKHQGGSLKLSLERRSGVERKLARKSRWNGHHQFSSDLLNSDGRHALKREPKITARQAALSQWLRPENFDAHGTQLCRLKHCHQSLNASSL